jgi:alkyl sulfatase BDS1-like metallo-beta-lactamase superfamily hydrolase
MLALRGDFHPRPGDDLDATYVLRFDDDQFVVRVKDGVLDVARGSTQHADAAMDTDARTFAALLTGKLAVDDAVRAGSAKVTGDAGALDRLFAALPRPLPAR